jgi:hypothetical protein
MIDRFVEHLAAAGLTMHPDEIADALWLAVQLGPPTRTPREHPDGTDDAETGDRPEHTHPAADGGAREDAGAETPAPDPAASPHDGADAPRDPPAGQAAPGPPTRTGRYRAGLYSPRDRGRRRVTFPTPTPPALPGQLALNRALRPLRRTIPSRRHAVFDAEATADRIAEEHIWRTVFHPAKTPRFDVALVVDHSTSAAIWRSLVDEFQALLGRHGAFRDVRVWSFDGDQDTGPLLIRPRRAGAHANDARSPRELLDPRGERIVIAVSDCVGGAWHNGAALRLLAIWGENHPVALLHLLPQRLWEGTGARHVVTAVRSPGVGAANRRLVAVGLAAEPDGAPERTVGASPVAIPVIVPEPWSVRTWADLVAGSPGRPLSMPVLLAARPGTQARRFEPPPGLPRGSRRPAETPRELLTWFRSTASPTAYRLAAYLAAAPVVTLPILRLVQASVLPGSRPSHLAEVFLAGILERVPADGRGAPDEAHYDFADGLRELLLRSTPPGEAVHVLKQVTRYVAEHHGHARSVAALLGVSGGPLPAAYAVAAADRPFARVAADVLRRHGSRYREVVDRLEGTPPEDLETGAGPSGDHVFLAYAPRDGAYAQQLIAHLRGFGLGVWSDAALDAAGGRSRVFRERIDSCAAFVVLMSPAAQSSGPVLWETRRAQARGRRVFPLLLSGEPFPETGDAPHEQVRGGAMPSRRWVDALLAAATDRPATPPEDAGSAEPDEPPPAAAAGPGRVFRGAAPAGHAEWVWSVAFAPDGRTLATGNGDGSVRLWDVAAGRQTAVLAGHTGAVWSVAFAPDGQTLASGSTTSVRLWETATGRQAAALAGYTRGVRSVVFAPDGQTLATGSTDGPVRLWETATGRQTAALAGDTGRVWSVAFAPDGRTLATGGTDGSVRLWETAAGRQAAVLEGHTDVVTSVAFAPGGQTLATGSTDGSVRLWETAAGRQAAVLAGHTGPVWSVAFAPDGRTLATGGTDGSVRLWETAAGRQAAVLAGHTGRVTSVAYAPDGQTLASGGSDGTARVWDLV